MGAVRPFAQLASSTMLEGSEGSTFTIDVSLDSPANHDISVDIEAIPATGSDQTEFSFNPSTISFATGEQTKTTTLTFVQDDLVEDTEEFTVRLTNPTPPKRIGALNVPLSGSVSDDDSTTVNIASISETVTEGGQAEFRVSLSKPVDNEVQVEWSTPVDTVTGTQIQTMAKESDLDPIQAITGSVTIPADTLTQDFSITTRDDDVPEGPESISVTLSNPTIANTTDPRVSLGTDTSASSMIAKNDTPEILQLAAGNGESPNLDLHDTVRVAWELGGADPFLIKSHRVGYVLDPGPGSEIPTDNLWTEALVAEAGASFFAISPLSVDTDYLVRVGSLSSETDALTVFGEPARVSTSALPEVSVLAETGEDSWDLSSPNPDPSLSEGEELSVSASLEFPVSELTEITVSLSNSGDPALTAETGDFAGASQTISIPAGDRTGAVTIATTVDADWDSEVFAVSLSTSDQVTLAATETNVTIVEPTPTVTNLRVNSGDSLERDSDRTITVAWTAPTAVGLPSISNYEVSWAPKPPAGDPLDSAWTTVTVDSTTTSLSVPSAAISSQINFARLAADTTYLTRVRAVIPGLVETWSDPAEVTTSSPAQLTLGLSDTVVTEGNAVTVEASIDQALSQDLEITLTPSSGASDTAEVGDFSDVAVTLVVPAGQTSGSATISTSVDTDTDAEIFRITPASASGFGLAEFLSVTVYEQLAPLPTNLAATPGNPQLQDHDRAILVSWDAPSGVMASEISHYQVGWSPKPESGPPEEDTWSTVQTSDGQSTTITISPNSGGILEPIAADSTYLVRVRTVLPGSNIAWTETVELTTAELPTVTIDPSYPVIYEGETLRLTASLSSPLSSDVAIDIGTSVTAPLSAEPTDFSLSSQEITIDAGQLSQTFDITALVDDDSEHESLQLLFSSTNQVHISQPVSEVAIREWSQVSANTATAVTASLVETDLSIVEGESETITVRLSGPRSSTISLELNLDDVSTTAGEDYSNTSPETLVFSQGVTEQEIRLVTVDDREDETDETLTLTLSTANLVGEVMVETQTITITIVDNDEMVSPAPNTPEPGSGGNGGNGSPNTSSPTTQTPTNNTVINPPSGGTGGTPSVFPGGGAPANTPPVSDQGSVPIFSDTIGTTHESNILRLAELGITRGCNPPENSRFCPERAVTRGEMATFMVRSFSLTDNSGDLFVDDDGHTHETNINLLATAEITRGCNPPENSRYCPDRPVTRAQMATFLARVMELGPGTSDFADTSSSVHANDISRIASVGITRGCNPPENSRFCPERAVTRGEMATFLIRAVDLSGV